jgi:hypothetical protein
LSGLDEDAASRAVKYIDSFKIAWKKTRTNTGDTVVVARNINRVADSIRRYLQDAEHYLNENRPSTSLASIAYAEGLLDALIFLELAKIDASQ